MSFSDNHKQSRQSLSFNSVAFLGSSVGLFGMLSLDLMSGYFFSTFLALIGYGYFGVRNLMGAWSSFSSADYDGAFRKGILSWMFVVILLGIYWLF